MAVNKHWIRWVFASVSDHFQMIATTLSLPLLVEGVDERSEENLQASHAELRINGPAIIQRSVNEYYLPVSINLLYTDLMGGQEYDAHKIFTDLGVFAADAFKPIPVKRFGDGVDDDDVQIGCLTLRRGGEGVLVHHFGQIGTTERVRESMLDAAYEITLP